METAVPCICVQFTPALMSFSEDEEAEGAAGLGVPILGQDI